jgi:hypothetical protein
MRTGSLKTGLLIATALGMAGCAADTSTITARELSDQTQHAVGNGDTSSRSMPATMHVFGKVLAIVRVPGAAGNDTLRFDPIAGATIKLWHNVLSNGNASSVLVGQATSGDNGSYDFPQRPGGYYWVAVSAPSSSGYGDATSLVPLDAQAEVNVYLGKAQQVPPSSPVAVDSLGLSARISAVEAFQGLRASLDLRWSAHTVEGVTIGFSLHVDRGSARLEEDHRADGGTLDAFTLGALELVRYVPGVWANNVEISKESLVPVTIADARAHPNDRYYLRGGCSAEACPRVF